MWVYEEQVPDPQDPSGPPKALTTLINTRHENVKYLPGIRLPENVLAVPALEDAVKGADLLVFVIPHQFLRGTCAQLRGHLSNNPLSKPIYACSLIKVTLTAV